MKLTATFEFSASRHPRRDAALLREGCDARAPGCKVTLSTLETKVLLSIPMDIYPVLRDYIAIWALGDIEA